MISGYLVGCVAALSAVVHAQDDTQQSPTIFDRVDTPFVFTGCAAPTEMENCWNAQNYTDEYLDSDCSGLQNRIDCALTNCWNRIYSCDYQQLVLAYNMTCFDDDKPALQLPFYPAPADAAGSCSCNLSKLSNNLMESIITAYPSCMEKVQRERGDKEDDEEQPTPDCDCCVYGTAAAAIWDSCQDQDPGYIALDALKQIYIDSDRSGNNGSLAQCSSRLQNFNCIDYGFTAYGGNASEYARPTPIHSATGTWSDMTGILTAPVSGATYTWTGWNATFTATAASVEAVATRTAGDGGKVSGSDTGSVTGTAIGTPSTSTGAAHALMAAQQTAAALIGLSGFAIALL